MASLSDLLELLKTRAHPASQPYQVPGLWTGGIDPASVAVDPYAFYLERLSEIAHSEPQARIQGTGAGEWSRQAVVYNLFPRVTGAFDHDGDGQIRIGPNDDGWRETGSLLKCIALLPYIRGMGFNTVHLLPITSVGQDGRKGTLGSPYAIRNPYQIDPTLDEPALGLSADELFAAYVDAAHLLGLRVILEFVLRTGARDSDWICEHPDWFYWIRADIPDRTGRGTGRLNAFGTPNFAPDTLGLIRSKLTAGDFSNLPAPSEHYRAMYTQPPRKEQISVENGRIFATLDDGMKVRVPGAFTDWPLDDNQPPWTDVTYLRMYNHPDFNYMAYNTLRTYDTDFARPENVNEPLWQAIIGVIPHYQRNFGIDGVMIDMGHALPMPLKQRIVAAARGIDPDFAFWDENFTVTPASREEGYNVVMGWWVLSSHEPHGLATLVRSIAHGDFAIPFFAAPESHNTPRAASRFPGLAYSHYALAIAITLPTIPFIFSGFELGESEAVNTGVGFSNEQIAQYGPERLGLFSPRALNWCSPENMVKSVRYALEIRHRYNSLFTESTPESFLMGYSDNPRILVYSRAKGNDMISVIANTDQYNEQRGRVVLNAQQYRVPGLWGTSEVGMDAYNEMMANVSLVPGYVLILDSSLLPR